ncbi:uncharacterized protein LY79DRAFT_548706 [Colletotrichum navitas]|uniref:Uncharacterized protein n=1 Tax=Colletotrichum navitas TaxID=681940 RepID=A0AAD8V6J0_9PEZI|nr:uncharacterized protein LY79DRAFT_548706 [Colletotrichum navitas]KAK1594874.1 hypothetical protein LY79DRAFT_548706 [Colletotrichum navitas]
MASAITSRAFAVVPRRSSRNPTIERSRRKHGQKHRNRFASREEREAVCVCVCMRACQKHENCLTRPQAVYL